MLKDTNETYADVCAQDGVGTTEDTKRCSKCGEIKEKKGFCLDRSTKDGRHTQCKSCRTEYNKSPAARASKASYDKTEKGKSNYIRRDLKRNYGMTLEQFNNLLWDQGTGCAVCGSKDPKGQGRFHVDHCHTTGRVRGLLCHHCNLGIGNLKDSIEILDKAKAYLQRFECTSE